ncbi:TerD family protein [Gordonia liuliyuniae]|uniref:TerD family protein n=1 Tax=Gordonia liuliyuniae TaxID=2911517 RepID=A0ABS9IQG1_9ACTN|nr:TerD family protein [Gordonia liuliyuniae]MCF8587793.1 TerD family protein [Gordonia liuliyuniae]
MTASAGSSTSWRRTWSRREAFAVAPSVTVINAAVLTRFPDTRRLGVVAFGRWSREAVERSRWQDADAAFRILDLGDEIQCSVRTTASGAFSTSVKPLPLGDIPALAALVADAEDVGASSRELAELDSELAGAARRDNGQLSGNPYQLRPLAQWLTAQSASPGFPPQQPNSTPPTMEPTAAVRLQGGQNVVLPEVGAAKLAVTFRASGAEADLSCLLLDDRGQVRRDSDFIFYNQPASPDGTVQLTGKYGTVLDFTESAVIYPSALPTSVARVLVVATMAVGTDTPFSALRDACLIATADRDRWEYEPKADPFVKAVILVEIYRHTQKSGERVWKLRALGQGWADGLAGLARDHGVAIDD